MSYKEDSTISLYSNRSSFKWLVLGISLIISAGSIIYTNSLVKQIRDREKKQIDLYAKTLEYLANENEAPNLNFIFEQIIQANATIPVILTDEFGTPEQWRNIPKADRLEDPESRLSFLNEEVEEMSEEHEPILVKLTDADNQIYGYKKIFYRNSFLLVQLRYYPYVQLSIIAIFAMITYAVFNYSRTAEQNRVWVGMAKETAHQLGTPLSSLIAWVEVFKETFPKNRDMFIELEKDVDRLNMITERFSNIGSIPQLKEDNIPAMVYEVIRYLEKRISTKVHIIIESFPKGDIIGRINRPLFAWVIENLVKNAVDAMEGKGDINIKIMRINEGQIAIDLTDSGKGISKSRVRQVFRPGFTTKKRGWGLGLALTRRIVENYHGGKIYVKWTEIDKGTTFRILLKS